MCKRMLFIAVVLFEGLRRLRAFLGPVSFP
jgi:hypothetical protein